MGRSAAVLESQSVTISIADELSLRFAPLDLLIANEEADERRISREHAEPLGRDDLDAIRAAIADEDSNHAEALARLALDMGLGAEGRIVTQRALRLGPARASFICLYLSGSRYTSASAVSEWSFSYSNAGAKPCESAALHVTARIQTPFSERAAAIC